MPSREFRLPLALHCKGAGSGFPCFRPECWRCCRTRRARSISIEIPSIAIRFEIGGNADFTPSGYGFVGGLFHAIDATEATLEVFGIDVQFRDRRRLGKPGVMS